MGIYQCKKLCVHIVAIRLKSKIPHIPKLFFKFVIKNLSANWRSTKIVKIFDVEKKMSAEMLNMKSV